MVTFKRQTREQLKRYVVFLMANFFEIFNINNLNLHFVGKYLLCEMCKFKILKSQRKSNEPKRSNVLSQR